MSKSKNADLKKKIISVCRRMNEMGINQGTSGNVSARTADGFVITASGVPYDIMTASSAVRPVPAMTTRSRPCAISGVRLQGFSTRRGSLISGANRLGDRLPSASTACAA